MTTPELIERIVASVDTYATQVAAPGESTPNAYQCVEALFSAAVGDDVQLFIPPELLEDVENIIVSMTRRAPEDGEVWSVMLQNILVLMDDLADNANE
jgi:hypothetical protein